MHRIILVLMLFCMVEGCYTTIVRVETVPPGSMLHFDYEPVGETPAEIELEWYGKHKVTLDHPEHGRREEIVNIKSPAYLYFPLDFFVALMPFKVTDRQVFTYDMTEKPLSETEAMNHESAANPEK